MFFSVGEVATSKWTHGEVAVFGFTVYNQCINVKGVTHGPGPTFASKRWKTDPRKDAL